MPIDVIMFDKIWLCSYVERNELIIQIYFYMFIQVSEKLNFLKI